MKIFKALGLGAIATMLSISANAGPLDSYNSRFEFVRNDKGEISRITDKTLTLEKGSFANDVNEFKAWFNYIQSTNAFSSKVANASFYNELQAVAKDEELKVDMERELQRAWAKLERVAMNDILGSEAFGRIVNYVERLIMGINPEEFQTLANLDNSSYFYKGKIIRQLVEKSIDFAGDAIGGMGAGVAIYLIKRHFDRLKDAKRYHQNILLYYVESFSSAALGLTASEHARTKSSLMEAEIDWFKYWQSQEARRDWDGYGVKKLERMAKKSNDRMDDHADEYRERRRNFNSIFREAIGHDGERIIFNAYDKKSVVNSSPSFAYDSVNPGKLKRTRRIYEVIKLATVFSPISGLGFVVKKYPNSQTDDQIRREGQLYGRYESQKDAEMLNILIEQTVNPFCKKFQ